MIHNPERNASLLEAKEMKQPCGMDSFGSGTDLDTGEESERLDDTSLAGTPAMSFAPADTLKTAR
jgi:hypothetical protein